MCILSTDFAPANCTTSEKGGVQSELYLINYADWVTATKTQSADGTYTAIALTTPTAKAVKYELARGATVPTSPFTKNAGGKSGWTHTVATFIPSKNQALKKELAALANFNRVVAIVVLDASIVSSVYGADCGLELNAWEEAPNDPAKGGGIQLTLATPPDVTLEDLPPVPFFDTNRADTLAALEALLVAVP